MKSCKPQRRSDLEVREADDELLVLDRRQEKIHKFNHSAAFMLDCCDGQHTVEQIIDRVAERYGAPVQTVRQDVANAVREFDRLGLLEAVMGDKGE
jgi:methyltransferase-like protein